MKLTILFFNIIGTFLVSAEAIKVENLRILAKIFNKGSNNLNPQIEFVDGNSDKTFTTTNSRRFYKSVMFIPLSNILLFWIFSYMVLQHLFPKLWFLFTLFISFFGGTFIWTVLIYSFKGIVLFLSFIEKKLSRGMIGIIGFLILVVSYFIQYLCK